MFSDIINITSANAILIIIVWFQLGTYPNSEDILSFYNVGLSTHAVISNLHIPASRNIYVAVKGNMTGYGYYKYI